MLALVALTVYALLRRFRPAKETMALAPQQRVIPPDLATDLVNPRRVRDPAVEFYRDPSASVGGDALLLFGTVTAALAALGMVGAQRLGHQAGLSVVVSTGTLLAALGLGHPAVTGGALFYLVSSTLAASALFLLIDLVERWRNAGATRRDEAPYLTPALEEQDVNLDDDAEPLVGFPFPASAAFLGLAFLACALLVTGMPPLSSFLGKLAMLSAMLGAQERQGAISGRAWLFLSVIVGTGLLSLIAMTRTGIRNFWSTSAREGPRIRLAEGLPVILLLGACLALTLAAGPVSRYALETARAQHAPRAYLDIVLGRVEEAGHARRAP